MTICEARSVADREACWQIRKAVFIREQRAPEEVERDGLDELAIQLAEWTIAIAPRGGEGEIEWRGMSIARLHNGRIAFWREYWNPADLSPRG